MKYTCCAGIEYASAVAGADYDAIVLPGIALAKYTEGEFADIRAKFARESMQCNGINMFCDADLRLCGTGYRLERVLEYSKRLAERAHSLGAYYIGIGAPKSRSIYDDFDRERALDQLSECFCAISSVFKSAGVMLLIEAVCTAECNFIVNSGEAAQLARRINDDNIGMVYDVYHAMAEHEAPEDFAAIADLVKVLHLAEDVNGKRCYLSDEGYAMQDMYFKQIRRAGFDGECSIEAFAPDICERLASTLHIMRRLCGEATES